MHYNAIAVAIMVLYSTTTVDSRYFGSLKYGHTSIYRPFGLARNASYNYVFCTKLTLKNGHSLFCLPASAGCPKQGFQYSFIRIIITAGYDVLGVV